MDTNLRTNVERLTNGFLEEIIQLGGVSYTKESAENELKRRKEEVLKVAIKYIGKYYIKINDGYISVCKFTDIISNRVLVYDFIQFDNSECFISCIRDNDCKALENIEEFIKDYKEVSEKEYNKYVEKYNKISEYVNMVVKE